MIADRILPLLVNAKQTGESRWIACCPAHDDHSPSLAIREKEDKLLLHCFTGCEVADIVAAVGLELSDLFPDSRQGQPPERYPFPAADVLRCLDFEITFLQVCASAMSRGEQLAGDDYARLHIAAGRFAAAREAARL